MATTSIWEPVSLTVHAVKRTGGEYDIPNVPGKREKKTGRIFYDPAEALRLEFEAQVKQAGVTELRDAALLAVLGAPTTGNATMSFTPYQYHLNKMLFYQWKKLEEQGLGEAFPHDQFVAERKGPVPAHIDDDLARLEKAGLVQIKHPKGTKHQPVPVSLTHKGKALADALIGSTDEWFRQMTIAAKTVVLPLTPEKLRNKVHTDYPEFRRAYQDLDDA